MNDTTHSNDSISDNTNGLSDARLTVLALQAQIRALEAVSVYGETLELESMSAWCCSMEQQLRSVEDVLTRVCMRGGQAHG
jgi:hypothetical protein